MLWNLFREFDPVFSRGVSIPSYKILCLVVLRYMAYNLIYCILLINGIAIRARFWYLFVSTFFIGIA